jgi:gliding motility associated protien GldN
MKKRIVQHFVLMVVIFAAIAAKSQTSNNTPLDGAYVHTDDEQKTIMPYPYLRQADVIWQKRIWRIIDVREKENLPFKDPVEPFLKILLDGINSGEVTAYSIPGTNGIDSFGTPMTIADVNKIGAGQDTISVVDTSGVEQRKVVNRTLDIQKITTFRLKEDWIFDKQRSTMIVRIIGVEPVLDTYNSDGSYRGPIPMFWIYYPDLRKVLVKHQVFNPQNDAIHLTWDDLFEARMFSSYIFKESNVYDRRIQDYASGIDALLEADRVKNDLFAWESEVWSY